MNVYCDTCILIYALEHAGGLQRQAQARLVQVSSSGGLLATSDLVRLEFRVQPLRMGDAGRLAVFDAYMGRADIWHVPLTAAVFDRAAELRARHNFKLGDAIHLAAAIEAGCDSFLTNDARLAACPGVAIEVLA